MPVLIDSNVLLRSLHPGHPRYAAAENSVATLRLRNETLCIAPQALIAGRQQEIHAERDWKLETARQQRQSRRQHGAYRVRRCSGGRGVKMSFAAVRGAH